MNVITGRKFLRDADLLTACQYGGVINSTMALRMLSAACCHVAFATS
jgi:hypothetical protein